MVRETNSRRRALTRACYLSAIVNSLVVPGYSQETLSEKAVEASEPLKYGPFDILYGIKSSVVYDDNIYIRPTKQADVLWTISPNVTLAAGDYLEQQANLLTLSYMPSAILFTDQTQNDALDHEALLKGQWRPGAWRLGLQQAYQNFSGAVIDAGNRVNRQIYTTTLSAAYEFSPRTSFGLDGRQGINNYDRLISYNEWVIGGWIDYEVMPLLKTGLGVTGGFLDVDQGANQTYQQILARASYSLTELIDVRASAGGELREFQGGQKDRVNPVFTLGATYRPLENTAFKLDAYRRSQSSVILQDQNYTTTGFSAGVRQLLFENYAVNLTGGYEESDYTSNRPGVSATRNDKYFFTQIGLDWNPMDRLTVGAFYQYRDNDSTDPNHSFNNHQVGLNVGYKF